MPRYSPIPKTVQGQVVHHRDFKKAILAALEGSVAGKTLADIAEHLGPEHSGPAAQRRLYPDVRRLQERGAIELVGRGRWVVGRNLETNGVSIADQWDRLVLKTVRDNGGLIRHSQLTWELLSDNETRYRQRKFKRKPEWRKSDIDLMIGTYAERMERGQGYKALTKCLQRLVQDGRLRRDFNLKTIDLNNKFTGWYNLPHEEMARIPMPGWIVDHTRHFGLKRAGDEKVSEARMDRLFHTIGRCCFEQMVMLDLDPIDLIRDPEFNKQMELLAQDCDGDMLWIRDEAPGTGTEGWERDPEFERDAAGQPTGRRKPRLPEGWTIREWELVRLYQRFESFRSRELHDFRTTHLMTTVPFYRALAKLLKVDPIYLTRGIVLHTDIDYFALWAEQVDRLTENDDLEYQADPPLEVEETERVDPRGTTS